MKHSNNRHNNNNFKFNDDASTHNDNNSKDSNRCRKRAITTFEMIALTIRGRKIIRVMIITSAETNTAEMDIGTKVADGARGTVIIIETVTEAAIETAVSSTE